MAKVRGVMLFVSDILSSDTLVGENSGRVMLFISDILNILLGLLLGEILGVAMMMSSLHH
jgi:hypothetical protein